MVKPGVGSLLCLVGLDNATQTDICRGLEPVSVLETVFVKTPSFLFLFIGDLSVGFFIFQTSISFSFGHEKLMSPKL